MEAQRSHGQNRNSAPGIIISRVFRFRHLLASGAIACLVCLLFYLANRIFAGILQSLFPRKSYSVSSQIIIRMISDHDLAF